MAINALQIVAFTAELARRHAAYISQCCKLVLVRFVVVVVSTRVVWTVVSQEVDIAHFHLFNALDFLWIVLNDGIDALTSAVARDFLGSLGSWLWSRWRRGNLQWCVHSSGSPGRGTRIKSYPVHRRA